MKQTLFDIGADVLALNELLEAVDGDPSKLGEAEAAVMAWLTSTETAQAVKFDGYLNMIRELEMRANAAKLEAEDYAAKRRAYETRADYLKARLLGHLEATKQQKVTTAAGRVVSVVKNGGAVPIIYHERDPGKVPEEYTTTNVEVVLDKDAIRAALVAGQELAFAELGERGVRLSIK